MSGPVNGPVLVTGVGGPSGRSVATQLVARGYRVLGVDMADVTMPGVVTRRVPAASDPAFVRELIRLAGRHACPLVIPTVSEELPLLAGTAGVLVAVGPPKAVAAAHDKWLTFLTLWDAGVPVPRSCLGGAPAAVLDGAELVSKPRFGRGARGVVVHRHGGPPVGGDMSRLVQEYLPGREYAVNVYAAEDPEHDVVQVFEKTALSAGEVGNATALRRVDAPDVAALARAAVGALGLRGPCDVDVRRHGDGNPAVLEVNARFGAHSARTPALLDMLLAERLGLTTPA